MPFPYLAPLSPWIVDIMKAREENPMMGSFKNPYAVLTSGALVVKGAPVQSDKEKRKQELIGLITNPPQESYQGCIIANNINNLELTYSLGETAVGVDFTGKIIKVASKEQNRKIPTPLIQTIELDTDGANNALKTARVTLKLFSLKQLEMFELFFMKPGMHVLLEFGDATLLKKNLFGNLNPNPNNPVNQKRKYDTLRDGKKVDITPYNSPHECLYNKNVAFDNWCQEFSKFFRADTTAFSEYLTDLEKSLGTYERIGGKILDYSFSIDDDGTYEAMIEISAGNQVSLALPVRPPKGKAKSGSSSEKTTLSARDQIINLMIVDFNLGDGEVFKKMIDDTTHPEQNGKWENDWFNFLKVNEQQKDTVASQDAYVSLRFIIEILMNYVIAEKRVDNEFFKMTLPNWKTPSGKEIKAIPVSSNKFIMSSTDDIIFPSKELPVVGVVKKEQNEIGIIANKTEDGIINGYDFHLNENLLIPSDPLEKQIKKEDGDYKTGNACNIFIKYEKVVKLWNSAMTRIDFLEKILSLCNSNSYGLFTLIYGLQYQDGPPTIIDAKAANDFEKLQNEVGQTYRFKVGTLKSNVKQFSFDFEMSNLVAGRQVFNSGKLLSEAVSKKKGDSMQNVSEYMALPPEVFKSIDNSSMGNADGWWSINNVELKRIYANYAKAKPVGTTTVEEEEKKKETSTTEAKDLTDLIDNKSIKFLFPNKKVKKLIYKDSQLINGAINKSDKDKETNGSGKSVLSPIDITLVIDGFSGFTCGQYFEIDGVPEIYNKTGVFQITNVKHSVSQNDWITTIEAGFRTIDKK